MRAAVAFLLASLAAPAAHATMMSTREADYGSYVQGHLALANGELGRAAEYFAGALTYAPDDPQLLRQTFDLAIAAGDEALAVSVGERLARQDRFDSGVTLLLVADAIKARKWNDAREATARLTDAGFGSFIVPIIDAWIAQARGKTTEGLRKLAPEQLDGFARTYVLEHRAHLLFNARKYAEAAEIYDELSKEDGGRNIRMRIASARALQAEKQPEEALKRLSASAAHTDVEAAKAALAAGTPILGIPANAREGVALLALRMAADLSRERPIPVALTLARIATMLAPEQASGWFLTSELLATSERYEAALDAVRKVPGGDEEKALARGQEAAILTRLDREPEAMQLLENAANAPDASAEDMARYGDALQSAKRFPEAAAAYDKALAIGPADPAIVWRLHFLKGSALEQGGMWPEAEAALREAVRLQPGDATLLNYLGYALLDRGLSTPEARMLIEKAHALAPEDGYITDSLGWAQYQAGEYAAAAATLEQAVAAVADDPVITEHLGDAYWMVGRRIEARHRWKAALDAGPTPERIETLEAKYDYGLDLALKDTAKK
ncbi:tetratricopeptide repeat protein [Sphingosinicella soli]|uniref:Tetratricopeptide (TPR) repeat protein n=1 Tax=Sphingosinicella soli TaxID=333708 RepID=A0A7W7AY80_9SPHN|nr:tetratricopeptide repeat protein [Sphingosinicella soli]MBB4630586.1 tetratricopeptide (TPR) repeat protein [Sphingosinicella soli]